MVDIKQRDTKISYIIAYMVLTKENMNNREGQPVPETFKWKLVKFENKQKINQK